jgi:predicted transcriptional regulator
MDFTVKDLNKVGSNYRNMAIRQLREPLLKAFDIYKSNVYYGIESETTQDRIEITDWYQDLLDKKESALRNVPLKIQRYL